MADLTGQMLGQYQIGARIGRGGMASVYRARQLSMDRDVAIKIISGERSGNPEFMARFEREARVIAHLQHPHILPVIDFGRSGEHVYLVMRLAEGGALSDRIAQDGLTLRQVARFVEQIASALEYAHLRGVIHRDLKPNNVLLDELDNAYLTDFGIAKLLAGSTSSNLTSTGAVMGTPAYMAPEQWRSEPVDARTDLYALGVILYELLIGAPPFHADTPFGMMFKHVEEAPPPPCRINPALPDRLERVLLCALAKNPARRYASAAALMQDFRAALDGLPEAVLSAPLPRATPDEVIRAATPSPNPAPAPQPAARTVEVTPPNAIAPPVIYTRPPIARSRPAARRARRPKSAWLWAAFGAAALLIVALGVAGIYLALERDRGTPPPVVANGGESPGDAPLHPPLAAVEDVTVVATLSGASADPTTAPATTATTAASPTPAAAICGSLASRVQANQAARTTLLPALHTTVRATPGLSGVALRRIPPGQVFQVLEGPACADSIAWWRIEGVDASGSWSGWIGEGREGTYWIEPLALGEAVCPGAQAPRLTPGGRGRVTLEPPLPSRVRAEPHTGGDYLGQFAPGQVFDVLSGPVCDAAARWWWLVRGRGLEGWIAEGAGGEYYLEPVT